MDRKYEIGYFVNTQHKNIKLKLVNREKHLVSKHISQRIKQCLIHEKLSPKNREVRATLGLTGLYKAAPPKAGLDPSSVRSAQYLANKILYCNIDAFKVI